MEDKAKAISKKIESEFPNQTIEYHFANELHKFKIIKEKVTYWLYIDRNYVDDKDEYSLINLIDNSGIINALKISTKSKWLYLNENGVREVDEHFAKRAI